MKWEAFIIAKAGKPLVKVMAIEQAAAPKPCPGFMKGRLAISKNFDPVGHKEISGLFHGA